MRYKLSPMPTGTILDTSAVVSQATAVAVANAGYQGIARYVPLPNNSAESDISPNEMNAILDCGLGLLLVQHAFAPGWDPGQLEGGYVAQAAIDAATKTGYLKGAHLFLDLEGPSAKADASETIVYAQAWSNAVVAAGYRAGCYVGWGLPLSPQELYYLSGFDSYWSDADSRRVATRGFAIKQGSRIVEVAGVEFDTDAVNKDELGETPVWMTSA